MSHYPWWKWWKKHFCVKIDGKANNSDNIKSYNLLLKNWALNPLVLGWERAYFHSAHCLLAGPQSLILKKPIKFRTHTDFVIFCQLKRNTSVDLDNQFIFLASHVSYHPSQSVTKDYCHFLKLKPKVLKRSQISFFQSEGGEILENF